MNSDRKKMFLQRWKTTQQTAFTHPYIEWVADISQSPECKQLHGQRLRVNDPATAELIRQHTQRNDAGCGCRIRSTK